MYKQWHTQTHTHTIWNWNSRAHILSMVRPDLHAWCMLLKFHEIGITLGKGKCRDTSSGSAFRHSRSLSGFCPVFKLPDQHQMADKWGVLLFKEMKKLKLKSQISGECGDQSRAIKRATTGLSIHHGGMTGFWITVFLPRELFTNTLGLPASCGSCLDLHYLHRV